MGVKKKQKAAKPRAPNLSMANIYNGLSVAEQRDNLRKHVAMLIFGKEFASRVSIEYVRSYNSLCNILKVYRSFSVLEDMLNEFGTWLEETSPSSSMSAAERKDLVSAF